MTEDESHLFHFLSPFQERSVSLLEYILRAHELPCQLSAVKILSANLLGCISSQGGRTKGSEQVYSSLTAVLPIREQHTSPFGSEFMPTHAADWELPLSPSKNTIICIFPTNIYSPPFFCLPPLSGLCPVLDKQVCFVLVWVAFNNSIRFLSKHASRLHS